MSEDRKCCEIQKASTKGKFVIFWNMSVIWMITVCLAPKHVEVIQEMCHVNYYLPKLAVFHLPVDAA
jgi:hypothetical protein